MTSNLHWWKTWSPDLAYVLGFAFADGAVQRKRQYLRLTQREPEVLERIHAVVPGGRLKLNPNTGMWHLRFSEPGLGDVLAPHGIVPNKTEFGFWPPLLPNELLRDYVRGFFDGDGHIRIDERISPKLKRSSYAAQIVFTCHLHSYIEDMQRHLHAAGFVQWGIVETTNGNFWLRNFNPQELVRLFDWIYDGATLFMERKHATFLHIATHFRGRPDISQGEAFYLAKLAENDVREIRRLWATGKYTYTTLAREFGTNRNNIAFIVTRQTWKHVE